MTNVDKADLSEHDICTQFITPAIQHAGWDLRTQVREEVTFTRGRIIVRGQLVDAATARALLQQLVAEGGRARRASGVGRGMCRLPLLYNGKHLHVLSF